MAGLSLASGAKIQLCRSKVFGGGFHKEIHIFAHRFAVPVNKIERLYTLGVGFCRQNSLVCEFAHAHIVGGYRKLREGNVAKIGKIGVPREVKGFYIAGIFAFHFFFKVDSGVFVEAPESRVGMVGSGGFCRPVTVPDAGYGFAEIARNTEEDSLKAVPITKMLREFFEEPVNV